MLVKIDVTQAHINKGIPCDEQCCPIGLALNERVINAKVLGVTARIFDYNKIQTIALHSDAVVFIQNFDRGLSVYPFSFNIDVREEFLRNE